MATQMQFWEVFLRSLRSIEFHSHFYAETLQQSWDSSTGHLESALSALLECRVQFHFVEDTCWPCCMHCTYLYTKLQDNCDTFLRRNVPHTRLDRSHALSEYLCCRQNNKFFFFLFPFLHFFDFSLSFFSVEIVTVVQQDVGFVRLADFFLIQSVFLALRYKKTLRKIEFWSRKRILWNNKKKYQHWVFVC